MSDIFLPNCRIEQTVDGIHFYEQDILCCEYIFTGDLKINIKADILTPGFGVVLLKDNSKSALEATQSHIFKIGSLDFAVIKKMFSTITIPVHSSCSFVPPAKDTALTFIKTGAKIQFYIGDIKVGEYMMAEAYDSYRIGFYSNAGNTIKYADIYGGTPSKWNVNVKNTNGGRIKFFLNGLTIENCEHDLEVEQDSVPLKKGSYILNYDKSNESDINAFIFSSDSAEVDDTVKNIVDLKDDMFVLDQDSIIDLKFKGHAGTVKNVCIKDDPRSGYVSTEDTAITIDGSWIKINMVGLTKIDWSGIIYNIPDQSDLTKKSNYDIVATLEQSLKMGDLNIALNKSFDYTIDAVNKKLRVSDKEIDLQVETADANTVMIFNNVNAVITKLILTDTEGNEINVIIQKTYKFYLPASISGPVIVTDENEIPLEISSSYRITDDNQYIFTNWEREVFNAEKFLSLSHIPLDNNNIILYGIKEDTVCTKDNIYNIPNKDSINSIDLYAATYTILGSHDYDTDESELSIEDSVVAKYKYFVVDYLKKDSYCINYISSLDNNEVDISTEKELLYIIHEKDTSNGYIVTEIKPDNNKYIVLRKAAN